jgi:hypothetical protein
MRNDLVNENMARKIEERSEELTAAFADAMHLSAQSMADTMGVGLIDLLKCLDWFSYNPDFHYENLKLPRQKAA